MTSPSVRTTWLHERLDRWRGGELAARDELTRELCGRLHALADKMLRGFPAVRRQHDAADVMQGSSMRLVRALETIRPGSMREFFGLAAVQVRRELLDLARQVRRGGPAASLDRPDDTDDSPRPEPAAPTESDDLQRWCHFHEEVERLPIEEREVVGLMFYHGWTQAEVAELLQVTERTVRRWWTSALAKLRAGLGPLDESLA